MQRIPLSERSWLELHSAFLPPNRATALHDELVQKLQWEHRAIRLFGKEILQPRLIAWCGTEPYTYSGQTLDPRPEPSSLHGILAAASEAAHAAFNHILLNRYRDGKDSMGLHADNEPELGPSPVVATLSLGITRRFLIKSRKGKTVWQEPLTHGSLLVMAGECQAEFKHGVPKQVSVTDERISLTFRRILSGHGLQR